MLKEFLQDICQLVMIDNYTDYLSFCLTISTTIFASCISILTLSIAFISNKKDLLKQLLYSQEQKGTSLTLAKQIGATTKFIMTLKEITNKSILTLAISVISILLYCLFKLLQPTCVIHVLSVSIIISIYLMSICVFKLCKLYYKK